MTSDKKFNFNLTKYQTTQCRFTGIELLKTCLSKPSSDFCMPLVAGKLTQGVSWYVIGQTRFPLRTGGVFYQKGRAPTITEF